LAGDIYPEIREQIAGMGFREYSDYFDWWINSDWYYPYERQVNGVRVGKYTGLSFTVDNFQVLKSVGNFCSINKHMYLRWNHPTCMLSTNGGFHSGGTTSIFDEHHRILALEKQENEVDSRHTGHKITIGNDVWIGANVFINASTVAAIGDGAIIGAGSVVTKDVPPYAVVYGAPARVQRYRYTAEQIECLLRVKWWDWDDDTIRENAELFIYPEKFFARFM
jgi:acetyltransferase-like isoleucine patch superfamily enzyme